MVHDFFVRNTTAGPVVGFSDTQPVRSRSAALDGTASHGEKEPVCKWLGIPYAKAGRFERPTSPEPWKETLKAFEFGSCFPQKPADFNTLAGVRLGVDRSWVPQSEQSHFINVFAPEGTKKGDDLRVLVWVYGGALEVGSASLPFFDATNLVHKNKADGLPAVIVSFEYRVNVFGFASHPDLAREDPDGLSGNYGLYDCVAAFEWIQQNIREFGGDPDNVCAFGESAGAFAIANLLVYKRSVLFQRAVMQSAAASTMLIRPPELAYPTYGTVMQFVGATSAQDLKRVPVEKLLEAHLRTAGFGSISLTIETGRNAVWDEPSIDKLRRGDWAPWIKSIMIGVNDDEGTGYAAEQGLTTATGWKFVLDSFPEALRADIQRYYLPGGNETLPDPSNIIDAPATKVYGDQLFYHPVRDQVLAMANTVNSSTQQPVGIYLYRASVTTLSLIPAALGKAHAAEVPHTFYQIEMLNETELKAAAAITQRWAIFSATGTPGADWPAVTASRPVRFVFEFDGSYSQEDPSSEFNNPIDLSGDFGVWNAYHSAGPAIM